MKHFLAGLTVALGLTVVFSACTAPDSGSGRGPAGHAATHQAADADDRDAVVVSGPTVIAFFPINQKELQSNQELNESFTDFEYYLPSLRTELGKLGIRLYRRYTETIVIVSNGVRHDFAPREEGKESGYYLMTPGKKPYIISGVLTDTELVFEARRYFGIKMKK